MHKGVALTRDPSRFNPAEPTRLQPHLNTMKLTRQKKKTKYNTKDKHTVFNQISVGHILPHAAICIILIVYSLSLLYLALVV